MGRHADAGLAVVGGWPILLAWFLGLHTSYSGNGVTYLGYLDKVDFWPMVLRFSRSFWQASAFTVSWLTP